jgi:tRNA (guanine37-N1)-methyltransferase
MRFDIISVVPDLLESPLGHSIMKRAQQKALLEVQLHNLRDYTQYKQKQVDDYVYGGGAGMVLMIEPLVHCIEHLQQQRNYNDVIYMTPDGKTLTQQMCNTFSLQENIMIICGHYKGIDERVREHFVTKEISIGDYVLSGGELAAAVLVDSIGRLIPGVLSDETSALTDSFQDNLLAPPVYSRPENFRGWQVPDVLLSGNHTAIDQWRYQIALERTQQRRPDLLGDI